MPKKYKQKSLLTKPVSSASSTLSLTKASSSQDDSPKRTVNDLIRESRRGSGQDTQQAIQIPSSIPPPVRAVLNMPALPSPLPRTGSSGPRRTRRIPGPPPPRSWLTDSIHAPAEVRDIPWSKALQKIRVQRQSSILPEGEFPSDRSLQHLVMKAVATDWTWHAEYDHEYLLELPVKIRQIMLSYIAIFNDGRGPNPLKTLFPTDLPQDELNEVKRLDLGGAIGTWTTLRKIEKELEGTVGQKIPTTQVEKSAETDQILEAWDEDDMVQHPSLSVPLSNNNMRFHNLKHLSLAITPGTSSTKASWAGLLTLATKLSTITSLSLAYWPQPTYTPNASTSRVKISSAGPMPAVVYGGSNYYTAFDNDWREAAGILRTLSRALYCLKWLDLTGCGEWFRALTWTPDVHEEESAVRNTGPDWNGSWRGLEYLVLAVGWSPGPVPSGNPPLSEHTETRAGSTIPIDSTGLITGRTSELLSQLSTIRLGPRETPEVREPEQWNVEHERDKYYHRKEVERYSQILSHAKEVTQDIRSSRKYHGGKWIEIDLGPKDDP